MSVDMVRIVRGLTTANVRLIHLRILPGYKWGKSGIFIAQAKKPMFTWGLVGVAGLTFMVFTSIPIVRRRLYNIFMVSHILGLAGFLLGLAMHVPEALPYVLAGAGLYALELICRAFKTKVATAELKIMPGADSIVVSIPRIRTGWRAGQHVILRVPALVSRAPTFFIGNNDMKFMLSDCYPA
jgi:ferric-chelate reductase